MSKVIAQIFLFILVTTVLIAFFAHLHINIFVNIALSILLQYAGFTAYRNIMEMTVYKKIQQLELAKLKEASYQLAEVVCPCSKNARQIVPLRLNINNYYKCEKTVAVYIAIETATTTEPITNVDMSTINNLLSNKLNESAA